MKFILSILFLFTLQSQAQIINASSPYRVTTVAPPPSACSDTDAQKFIDSSGISGTNADAICTLVKDLKDSSLWTSMNAIYPFVGGTASTHKWNLVNPGNSDAAFRLVFTGTWSHSSTGANPNGTDAYANTFYNPIDNASTTSRHLSFYSREDVQTGRDIGSSDGSNSDLLHIEYSDGNTYGQIGSGAGSATAGNTAAFYIGSRIDNTDSRIYKNGVLLFTKTSANLYTTDYSILIGNINIAGGPGTLYSNREVCFVSLGDGLTAAQSATLNTIVEKFNDALSRGVQ